MKQTAVEWLFKQIKTSKYFYKLMEDINSRSTVAQSNIFEQAKEMEKQQQDEFAIGFAEWILIIYNEDIIYDAYSKEELLEIYKKENGL